MEENRVNQTQIERTFQAVRHGNNRDVRRLLRTVSVHCTNDFGETFLIVAAFSGHFETVELLLSEGSSRDIDASDHRLRQTALIRAARIGHAGIVRLLIREGANLNSVDHQEHTALMKACASGHVECAELLTRAGAILNAVDGSGFTALMKAAFRGNLEILMILILAGCHLDLTDSNGNTALKKAVAQGHPRCVRALLDHGADPCTRDVLVKVVVNWYTGMERDESRLRRDLECVQMLCDFGAYVNAAGNSGNTLLMCAATIGYLDCVTFLLAVSETNVNACNDCGHTALMIAARTGRVDITNACLERGARVNVVDMSGYTAIMHAASHNRPECVETLAQHEEDVNVVDEVLWTPLNHMARRGHLRCVEVLIQHGADISHLNANGQSAIDIARSNGNEDIAQLLISRLEMGGV